MTAHLSSFATLFVPVSHGALCGVVIGAEYSSAAEVPNPGSWARYQGMANILRKRAQRQINLEYPIKLA